MPGIVLSWIGSGEGVAGLVGPPSIPRPKSKERVSRVVKRRAANIHPHFPQRNSPVSLSLYLRGCSAAPDREFMVSSNAPATATFFSFLLSSTSQASQSSLLKGGLYQAQTGAGVNLDLGYFVATGTAVPTLLPTLLGLGVIRSFGGQYTTNLWLALTGGDGDGLNVVCLMRSSGLYQQYFFQIGARPCWLQQAGTEAVQVLA